ncbi:Transketolase [Geodia barretti]|uniref:transketolase n=1 Tax=Geodia barretti TaxID=519541 RepID=A0AA35W4V9_GEOBA|nr:Transketolase [Geodia barretti]
MHHVKNFILTPSFCVSGEDGPSQMALEDFAMFRTIPGAVCFYPSDAVSAERAFELAANHRGVTFTRTSRPATAVVYENTETFEIGKSKVLRKSDGDKVTVVGAGVTLHEALAAHKTLQAEGINIRVVDAFCLKPVDKALMVECGKATGGRIVTVEDHYFEGGLGEGVAAAVAEDGGVKVHRLAVTGIPRSGPAALLMEDYGISANCIVKAVKKMLA